MNAVRALRQRVSIKASVRCDGHVVSIPAEEVIPGDVVLLSAGSLIPADGLILTAKDFYVSQATLTGETFPVDKQPGIVPPEAILAERSNCVFMGTSVLGLAYDNARLQSGIANPLDEAIAAAGRDADIDCSRRAKVDEIPDDFVRKRLSVVVSSQDEGTLLITKGSVQTVLEVCELMSSGNTHVPLDAQSRAALLDRFADWSKEGYRVLGVSVKIITGDNRFIASHVAGAIGIKAETVITGEELSIMSDEALWHSAPLTSVFAEVDPNQKERIIAALQHSNHVVGFIGDGINDSPALYAADVGISVDQAADVAKEAPDLVLLEHDLSVVATGIAEGRRTFANTLKYIFITTSANFGNMISMACASLFLPFLPLLAKLILLNNFLSDIPAIGIAGNRVNENWGSTPHRWDIRLITRFMLTFVFDQHSLRSSNVRCAAVSCRRYSGAVPHRLVR